MRTPFAQEVVGRVLRRHHRGRCPGTRRRPRDGRQLLGVGRAGARRGRYGGSGRPGGVDVQARRRGQGFGNADSRSRRSAGPLRRHAAFGAVRLRLYAFCDVTANLTVL